MTLLAQLTLARPWWLLALLPLAAWLWLFRSPAGTARWTHIVDAHLQPHVLTPGSNQRGGTAILVLAWLLAVLALAGPQLDVAGERDATRRDSVRVLVVDLSPGVAPQLERIKLKLHALLNQPHSGETALMVYAEEPFLVVPPTSDTRVVARFVPELAVDAMPAAGNRPERAVAMARALLARSGVSGRDIVWLTGIDWHTEAAEPELAGIRLSVLHAGDKDMPVLRKTAERSGGILLAMRADDTDLNMLADTLDADDRRAAGGRGTELGPWLLLPLLPLVAMRFRSGMVFTLLPLALCAGFLPAPAEAASRADTEARRLFDAGRYAEAAARFSDPRWKAAAHYRAGRYAEAARLLEGHDDPDSLYNRANALARQGRLQEALAGYEASLQVRPGDPDTVHNRDLVRSLLNSPQGGGKSGGGSTPPPNEANRVAEQWLRNVPDDPGTLLRRKLQEEHKRRVAGEVERPW